MENKVKIDAAVLRGNRMELSNIGGTLGGRFFRLNKHAIDDEYGNLIAQIRNTGNKELCLNRGINRYAIQASIFIVSSSRTQVTARRASLSTRVTRTLVVRT